MEVYQVGEDELSRVPESELSTEQELEEHLIKSRGAVIGDVKLLYIDRQGSPSEGGIFDILAVDGNGNLVIVELKRNKTPRDIVAQALEYVSTLRNESYDDLEDRYQSFLTTQGVERDDRKYGASLQTSHAEHFDVEDDPIPESAFNADQRLILVGTEFQAISLNMADFLRDHGIDVVCVEYQSFASDDGVQLLTTQCIRRPLSAEPTGTSSDDSETEADRTKREFWESVAEEVSSRQDTPLGAVNPGSSYHRDQATPVQDSIIRLSIDTQKRQVSVHLLIRDDRSLFAHFEDDSEAVEAELGTELEWVPPDQTNSSKERCKIRLTRSIDLDERTDWGEAVKWIVDRGEQFHTVFNKRLATY